MLAEAKLDVVRPETVNAPDELLSPEPVNLLNDEPLTMRFVVEAVRNDA
jgi:hypothetical protein